MDDDQRPDGDYDVMEGDAAAVAASAVVPPLGPPVDDDPFADRLRLGSLIRSYRRYANWSQSDLSRESGIPQEMITRIERGTTRRPQVFTLERLANALARPFPHMTAQELLTDFLAARDSTPAANIPDSEAQLISGRLRHHSTQFKKLAYDAINALLDALEAVSQVGR
jgi:transcriptional regulator with XRE-family HTH domain